jgi:hypothetical protein
MAIAVTALTSGGDDTYLFSYSTASIAPASGSRGKLYIESTPDNTDPTAPTVSGAYATWTLKASKLDHPSNTRYWVYEGSGAVTSEPVVIDFGTTGDERFGCNWIVLQVTGAAAPSWVQSVFAIGTGLTASGTLAAFADAGNGAIIFGNVADNGETITPGTGWTSIVQNGGTAYGSSLIYAAWRADNDTSPDFSWSASLDWVLYAEEVSAAGGGDTTAPTLTDGPNVSNVDPSGFDVGGTSDENGTAMLLVTAPGASQPADAAFDASTETAAMTATTPFSIHHTGT